MKEQFTTDRTSAVSASTSRRRFLRRSVAFSAMTAFGAFPSIASAAFPADSDAEDLLMVGDWGADGDHSSQAAVAAGMRRYVQEHGIKPKALLMLGDNWYGDLDGGVQSPRWQTQFEQMYPADVFPGPAYAVPGNHDYERRPDSKVDIELAYARSGKSRWTMPSLWYRFEFPQKSPLITFLAVDGNVPSADGKTSHEGNSFFTMTPQRQAEQLAWLERELKRPRTTPFLTVMGHFPLYSDGPHGDHKILIRDWDPLFRKHKVDLYLAGHDHDLQHLEFEGHPTSFFMSGGGGAHLHDLKISPEQRGPYGQKVLGFSHLTVTKNQMTLRHVDSNGRILHAFVKTDEGKITVLTA